MQTSQIIWVVGHFDLQYIWHCVGGVIWQGGLGVLEGEICLKGKNAFPRGIIVKLTIISLQLLEISEKYRLKFAHQASWTFNLGLRKNI